MSEKRKSDGYKPHHCNDGPFKGGRIWIDPIGETAFFRVKNEVGRYLATNRIARIRRARWEAVP